MKFMFHLIPILFLDGNKNERGTKEKTKNASN